MPLFGLGTWLSENGDQCKDACLCALRQGYKLIDTAQLYENESSVGQAIAEFVEERGRDALPFVVTKLWSKHHDDPEKALRESLQKLQMDAVDLFLIHTPSGANVVQVWTKLLEMRDAGLTKKCRREQLWRGAAEGNGERRLGAS